MIIIYLWLLVQIVLESFPISSSGHCVLFERIAGVLGYSMAHVHTLVACAQSLGDVLEHFVHGATVVVLAWYFFPRWFFLLKNIKRCYHIIFKIIGLAFVADCCTALLYGVFHVYGKPALPLVFGFVMTAFILLSLRWIANARSLFDVRKAALLGILQGISLIPGISRFAITYVGGRWLGLSAHKAFEVSFLIQFPLIFVAFLNSMRIMLVCPEARVLLQPDIIAVMACATIIACITFAWVARLAYANKLWKFGVYMIVPITLWLLLELYPVLCHAQFS